MITRCSALVFFYICKQ